MTPETALKIDVMKYLRSIPGRYSRVLQVGIIPGRTNASKGMFDIVTIFRGKVDWIELKAPDGKMSPEQETFQVAWTTAGGSAWVARSLDDVKTRLNGPQGEMFPPRPSPETKRKSNETRRSKPKPRQPA